MVYKSQPFWKKSLGMMLYLSNAHLITSGYISTPRTLMTEFGQRQKQH